MENKIVKEFWESLHYFKSHEFECPCCGKNEMDETFVRMLEMMRISLREPMIISSGYRCEKHNKEIGGAPNSAHLRGLAVDVKIPNSEYRYRLLKLAMLFDIPRIGIGSNFIHLDVDRSLPHPRIWVY